MPSPLFSILLPSRERVTLLAHALASVARQNFSDCEVIISDNVSDQDYEACIASFPMLRIRHLRAQRLLSVTENWNNALAGARGQYVLMLGDDDALAPGCLARIAEQIVVFERPDLIYIQAFHYTYPAVIPGLPKGSFVEVANSPLFNRGNNSYRVNEAEAHKLALRAFNLRHEISFNAQHFVLRREFVLSVSSGPFYQSPYPDFFSAMLVFRRAQKIIVLPQPMIIIGIAKQSFGYFFNNRREDEGFDKFATDPVDLTRLTGGHSGIESALAMPGSGHWRNWFIAALFAKHAVPEFNGCVPDLRRYQRIQLMELAQSLEIFGQIGEAEFWRAVRPLGRDAERWAGQFRVLSRAVAEAPAAERNARASALRERLNLHYPARVTGLQIGSHRHIMDAFDWLVLNPSRSPPSLAIRAYRRLVAALNLRPDRRWH